MPLGAFANRNFSLISGIGFLLGFTMFGAINFIPLYQQTVQGASATNSGLLLVPMMGAAMVVSVLVGLQITRSGRYKAFPVVGGVVMTLAMVLLAGQDTHTSRTETGLFIAVFGIGMGFLMQTTTLIAQNSVQQKDIGMASSAATFFRSIGGSFGVSLFGAVFNHRLTAELATRLGSTGGEHAGPGAQIDPATLNELPAPIRTGTLESPAAATSNVFLWAVVFAALIPVLAVFLQHIPLRGDGPRAAEPEPARDVVDSRG